MASVTTCIRGRNSRVLKDRHDDEQTGRSDHHLGCPGCLPCPGPHCTLCRRNHAAMTCPTCLARARLDLATIAVLAGTLEDEARNGHRALAVHAGIPGGDALVLLAPAATSHGRRAQLTHRARLDLDVTHVDDEWRGDPAPPLAVLLAWDERWRAMLGQPTDLAPTMDRVQDYLGRLLHDVADRPEFAGFAHQLEATVRQLEDVLHAGLRPETSRVPCWECGTRLEKVYADHPAGDHWRCPRCKEVYDRGRYDRAKHDHLASAGAERFVPVSDAVAAIGRPEQTVRSWMRRGIVGMDRDPVTRRVVIWWPDVRTAHLLALARAADRAAS